MPETQGHQTDSVEVPESDTDRPDLFLQQQPGPARPTMSRPLLIGATALFVLQFVFLCTFAAFIWHRFTLGVDFADYAQATNQIAHGNLNPYSTIQNFPWIGNDFELVTWPLGLLLFVFRSMFMLSVIQAAALVLAGFVAWRWIGEMLDTRRLAPAVKTAILLGALVLLLVDATVYFSTALDFHYEALATLFALLAARSLWRGRTTNAVLWAAVTLLCGNLGGLYVTGVGLSGLLSGRPNRIPGLTLLVSGVAWIGLVGLLHDSHGSLINEYAWLAGRASLPAGFVAAVVLIKGMTTHPGRVFHVMTARSRSHLVVRYMAYGGLFGFLTPWGFGVPVLVLLTSALQHTPLFLGEPFQQRAVVPFVLFGTASLVAALFELAPPSQAGSASDTARRARRSHPRFCRPAAVAGVAVIVLVGSIVADMQRIPTSFTYNAVSGFIPAGEAAALGHILSRTPSNAEVIVSSPISGRFAQHKYLYVFIGHPPKPIPLNAKTVVMVLDDAHTLQLASPYEDAAAVDYVMTRFGAQIIGTGPHVEAVEWNATPSRTSLLLP
jgi:hypothetical protein